MLRSTRIMVLVALTACGTVRSSSSGHSSDPQVACEAEPVSCADCSILVTSNQRIERPTFYDGALYWASFHIADACDVLINDKPHDDCQRRAYLRRYKDGVVETLAEFPEQSVSEFDFYGQSAYLAVAEWSRDTTTPASNIIQLDLASLKQTVLVRTTRPLALSTSLSTSLSMTLDVDDGFLYWMAAEDRVYTVLRRSLVDGPTVELHRGDKWVVGFGDRHVYLHGNGKEGLERMEKETGLISPVLSGQGFYGAAIADGNTLYLVNSVQAPSNTSGFEQRLLRVDLGTEPKELARMDRFYDVIAQDGQVSWFGRFRDGTEGTFLLDLDRELHVISENAAGNYGPAGTPIGIHEGRFYWRPFGSCSVVSKAL